MTAKLERLPDSVEDLTRIAVQARTYLTEESETALRTCVDLISQRQGLVARFFPDAIEKEQRQIAIHRLRSLAASRERMLELYSQTMLEIARKTADALVASVAMELQAELASFALAKIEELTATVAASQQRYMASYRPQKATIEEYRDEPELYDRASASLKTQSDLYFKTADALLTGFVAALDSRVHPRQLT